MIKSRKATSIVEVMVVMLVLVSGIVGMYKVYSESNNLSLSTKNKITAIQIAREGIEAVKNIRDTNWILFSADTANCWNVQKYNINCVGINTTGYDIPGGLPAKIVRDSNNRWWLDGSGCNNRIYGSGTHIDECRVNLDSNGLYTQSGGIEFKPIFTRYIEIEYLDDGRMSKQEIDQGHKNNLTNNSEASNEQKMKVHSVVQWADNSSSKPHKIEFTTILTNWQK